MKLYIALVALALALLSSHARACYVFGDSLTSPSFSWANQLIRAGYNLQVNAVPGRKLADLVIPPDTRRTLEIDCAIIHLGTNDQGSTLTPPESEALALHLQGIVNQLEDNGLFVYCVVPPTHDLWPRGQVDLPIYTMCPNLLRADLHDTLDGLHMTKRGHTWHAIEILMQLGDSLKG